MGILINVQYMDPKQIPTNKKETKIIIQMKFLANEAIDILYFDGLLPHSYLSALEHSLQEYFTRELRALRKRSFEYMFLSRGIGLLDQRPRRPQTLDLDR